MRKVASCWRALTIRAWRRRGCGAGRSCFEHMVQTLRQHCPMRRSWMLDVDPDGWPPVIAGILP